MSIINVILSGGVGSRLWPLSRKSQPKQYLPIFNDQSLFQKTVLRNQNLCDALLIVGSIDNYKLSRENLKNLGVQDYAEIIEACPRNTAAAIAFAAFHANPDDILFVTPSDQLIIEGSEYAEKVRRSIELAREGNIVTFGLMPTRPETGFGYIECKEEDVLGFREKPDLDTAIQFLEKGNFLWNSGMFCFKAGVFLEELKALEPLVYEKSKDTFLNRKDGQLDKEQSLEIPSISVDYAVMERTSKIKVVPSGFGWSDMGSFESIFDYLIAQGHFVDEAGNMVIGQKVHTEFVGLQNTLLIHTSDAILVLQKDKAQDVRKVYERLEKENSELVE